MLDRHRGNARARSLPLPRRRTLTMRPPNDPAQRGEIITRVQAQNLRTRRVSEVEAGARRADRRCAAQPFHARCCRRARQALNKISASSRRTSTRWCAPRSSKLCKSNWSRCASPTLRRRAEPVEPASARYNAGRFCPALAPALAPAPDGTRQELRAARDRGALVSPSGKRAATSPHSNDTSRPPYCIQLPPPNVTGTLHMGHAFKQTIMDALTATTACAASTRSGCRAPTTPASRPRSSSSASSQAQGKSRHDLGREKFVERVWEWKQESGSTITRQMRRMGDIACDWNAASTSRWTTKLSRVVTETFVRLYEEGLIYRGKRLVNWDPVLRPRCPTSRSTARRKTATSGTSAIRSPTAAGALTSSPPRGPRRCWATWRVVVHPEDERYQHLVGKRVDAAAVPTARSRSSPTTTSTASSAPACVKVTPRARLQRLRRSASATSLPIDRHPDARREDQRQRAGSVPRARPLRRAQAGGARDLEAQGLLVGDEAAQADGAALRPHRRRSSSRC